MNKHNDIDKKALETIKAKFPELFIDPEFNILTNQKDLFKLASALNLTIHKTEDNCVVMSDDRMTSICVGSSFEDKLFRTIRAAAAIESDQSLSSVEMGEDLESMVEMAFSINKESIENADGYAKAHTFGLSPCYTNKEKVSQWSPLTDEKLCLSVMYKRENLSALFRHGKICIQYADNNQLFEFEEPVNNPKLPGDSFCYGITKAMGLMAFFNALETSK